MTRMNWRRFASFFTIAALTLVLHANTARTAQPAITGEIVETYCWAKVRVGGTAHAACGIECAKRGIPVAIYDPRARVAYVLLPGRDKTSVPQELIAMMGRTVTIRGEIVSRGGVNLLTVQSWTK